MQRSFIYLLGFTALLGCDTETHQPGAGDKAVPQTERDAGAHSDAGEHQNARDAGTKSDSGNSHALSSVGATSQCDVTQCERRANDLAQSFMTPAALSISVKGGDCARVDIVGVIAGMACTCQSSNGWIYIGPEGAGCFARGRTGDCLWDDSEFEACSVGDPACSAMCTDLNRRYAADAAKTFDVEVRYSTCKDGSCHHVLRIEGACYADHSFESGRRFDCKLSDAEILEREASAHK